MSQNEPDRRAHDIEQDAQMARLLASVATLTDQVAEITVAQHRAARDLAARGDEIADIKASVKETADTSKEMLELFSALKGGFKVLGWLGMLAKGAAGLAAAAVSLWAAYNHFRHGGPK
jgi:hypothetical protein